MYVHFVCLFDLSYYAGRVYAVRAISTKFGMVTQFDPLDRFEG